MPVQDEIKEKAGGNGKGIRMSRDGKRVTYLSHVGYPKFSGNLAGWDPADLEKMPVTHATKGKGTTYDLAYHPVVPLVAGRNEGTQELLTAIVGVVEGSTLADGISLQYGHDVEEEITKLEKLIAGKIPPGDYSTRWLAVKLLEEDEEIMKKVKQAHVVW